MHDLTPTTALGGPKPRVDRFNHVTISENDGLALASVAARLGSEAKSETTMRALLGGAPAPGKSLTQGDQTAFWMGPDQWMVTAPITTNELLADELKEQFSGTASVTEQSGAWVCFDLTGEGVEDMSERLCAIAIRQMQPSDTQRTVIHQLGCFVIRMETQHLRILGPRASAGTLHHALLTAAESTA